MESKEMKVKLTVGTETKETRTSVIIEIVIKSSTRTKMAQQVIAVKTRMLKESLRKLRTR